MLSSVSRAAIVFALAQAATLLAAGPLSRGEGPEDFRVELTGSVWLVHTGGAIQSGGTPVDLVSDLGVGQQKPTFFGRLVLKPGRKQRIVVEGSPIRLDGNNIVQRTVVYRGQTFNASDTLSSSAELNYLFAGYQYDVLSGRSGHLGFSVGGAYLGAVGSINARLAGTSASRTETFGVPLAGAEFRIFPVPHHQIFEIEGGLRGMAFGSYGHFVEGNASAGVRFGPVGLLAGYRELFADFHQSGGDQSGLNARLKGPVFSALWRW
jgi:hypothetical protein